MVRLRMCGRAPRRDLGTPVPVRPRRAPGGCRAPTCRLAPAARLRPPQGCARRKAAPAARLRPPQGCARRKAAPGKAAFRRPSRRSIKVWICRYERAPLTIARIENRITPACPYILPSARRRSGMAVRQVRRSVVIRNLRVGLLAMDSDRLPLRKRKDVLHGAVRAVPLRHSVEQPWAC
jgi:hypothetical protein